MKNNPVAKNAHKFNKATVQKDRKKAMKKGDDRKHKGRRYEDSGDIEERSTLDAISSVLKRNKDRSKYQAALKAVKSGKYKLPKAAQVFDVSPKILQDLVAEGNETMEENGKGLWANIRAKKARGEKPAKPGDKDYPKTLDIESKNTPGDGNPCWDTHKKVGTKMKNGKEVNDCVPKNESAQDRLDKMAAKHGLGKPNKAADDYISKMMKKYGAKDMADLKKKMGIGEGSMDPRDFTDKAGYLVVIKRKGGKEEIKNFFNTKPAAQKYVDRIQKTNKVGHTASIYKTDGRKMAKEELQELTQADLDAMADRKKANLVRRGKAKAEPKAKRTYVGGERGEDDDHVIMQLRKAQDTGGSTPINVAKGKTVKLPKSLIDKLLKTHDKLRKPADKKKFMSMLNHELRKKAGIANKKTPSASDKAMAKFRSSRKRGIPSNRKNDIEPTDKELRNIR